MELVLDDPVLCVSASPTGEAFAVVTSNEIRLQSFHDADALLKSTLLCPDGESRVKTIVFSADGMQLVSGSVDGTVRLWGSGDAKPSTEALKGHKGSVVSVAFSPRGDAVVSGGVDGTLRVWSAIGNNNCCNILPHASDCASRGPVSSVGFTPDGTSIFSSVDRCVHISDAQGVQTKCNGKGGHAMQVTSVACSPRGDLLASASEDTTLRVWKSGHNTGLEMTDIVLRGHAKAVRNVVFSRDGKLIASGSDDSTVIVWSAYGGSARFVLEGHSDSVQSVTFSFDGRWLLSGSSDKTVHIWDIENVLASRKVRQRGVSSQSKPVCKIVHVWGIKDGTLAIPLKRHLDAANGVAFSPNSKFVACSGSDKFLHIVDISALDSKCDGSKDIATQVQEIQRRVVGALHHVKGVNSVAFSPNGGRIISGSDDATIGIWTADGDWLSELRGHRGGVNCVSFSPDGMRIASGSDDTTVRIWIVDSDCATPDLVLQGHTMSVTSVAFSPCCKYVLSGSFDKTARLFLLDDKGTAGPVFQGHTHWVKSVAFSPCGKHVVTGSEDCTIRKWGIDGSVVAILEGHTSCVNSVVFAPSGSHIASASSDKTIRLWDAASSGLVFILHGHTDSVRGVVFSPDGNLLASASKDTTVRVWKLNRMHSQTIQFPDRLKHMSISNDDDDDNDDDKNIESAHEISKNNNNKYGYRSAIAALVPAAVVANTVAATAAAAPAFSAGAGAAAAAAAGAAVAAGAVAFVVVAGAIAAGAFAAAGATVKQPEGNTSAGKIKSTRKHSTTVIEDASHDLMIDDKSVVWVCCDNITKAIEPFGGSIFDSVCAAFQLLAKSFILATSDGTLVTDADYQPNKYLNSKSRPFVVHKVQVSSL